MVNRKVFRRRTSLFPACVLKAASEVVANRFWIQLGDVNGRLQEPLSLTPGSDVRLSTGGQPEFIGPEFIARFMARRAVRRTRQSGREGGDQHCQQHDIHVFESPASDRIRQSDGLDCRLPAAWPCARNSAAQRLDFSRSGPRSKWLLSAASRCWATSFACLPSLVPLADSTPVDLQLKALVESDHGVTPIGHIDLDHQGTCCLAPQSLIHTAPVFD